MTPLEQYLTNKLEKAEQLVRRMHDGDAQVGILATIANEVRWGKKEADRESADLVLKEAEAFFDDFTKLWALL